MSKKTLTDQQMEAINLLVVGTMSKLQIASSIGVSEKTIYNWLNNNEVFKEQLQKSSDLFTESKILDAKNKLSTHLDMAIANIAKIAQDESNSKSFEANKYIIDRNLGAVTSKVETSLIDNKLNNSNDDEKQSYLATLEQDFESNNVIELDKAN
ncbi:hypothetical protein CBE01nite_29710 [Clostridium beijerinckii]|uniref:Homeodomain phBC6A51-type domain-containing protein n=1 Tax=Clostridium beijerinckii TaxID=1520 RepID=A0AB74VDC6_CLOBE|nr:phBC6A51 family helix-turn-helix protein [Clostridium beijerinckii]NRZ28751.1 transposase [Clostridium beijerinckii]NYB95473.1 transposase [Clostridium beijerinckii]OOM24588.1 hypothetical protein CLBEI_20490 [Clostridium beijerinckii]QUN34429.1 hypothetical protein KEC93_21270 [Clostridium beijerinckii]SQB00617.1 DNA-binding protein [Clostridium beijerinckii]